LAIYVFLAVGPYSLLIDICVTHNHKPSFISFLLKEGKETETVRELKSCGVFVGLPRNNNTHEFFWTIQGTERA